MSNTFASLKRNAKTNLEKLTQELTKLQSNQTNANNGPDERLWKPTVDKAGNGQAIIRFLPAPKDEDMPFVRVWDHGFQGPGGWYIEKSLTTLGEPDPVSELNTKLWNSGIESDKDLVRKQKRRLHYYSNIYVISDPGNPDNEGKVFLYQYGKKIFDKITDMMNPAFEDEESVNPFDFWAGANFKLRIRQVEGYRNYDKSEFTSPSPLSADDEELERVWSQQHSLKEFLDRKNFKTYDELKSRLDKALGLVATVPKPQAQRATEAAPPWDDNDRTSVTSTSSADDEDDDVSFFKKLASD